jgi:hypothetical protein
MSLTTASFQIRFPADYDAQSGFETPMRGYLSGVLVELENGLRYPVFFYDPIRLRQDIEAESALGRPYLAEPGMIILPEVTTDAIRQAVAGLVQDGFFEHVKPVETLAPGSRATPSRS